MIGKQIVKIKSSSYWFNSFSSTTLDILPSTDDIYDGFNVVIVIFVLFCFSISHLQNTTSSWLGENHFCFLDITATAHIFSKFETRFYF